MCSSCLVLECSTLIVDIYCCFYKEIMSVSKRHGPKLKAPARICASVMLISASMLLLCHTHNDIKQVSAINLDDSPLDLSEELFYESDRIDARNNDDDNEIIIDGQVNDTTRKRPIISRSLAIELMKPLFSAPRLETAKVIVPKEALSAGEDKLPSSLTQAISSSEQKNVPEITAAPIKDHQNGSRSSEVKEEAENEEEEEPRTKSSPIANGSPLASSSQKKLSHLKVEGIKLSTTNGTRKTSRALRNEDSVVTSESKQIERNSECALILKRTYILANPQSDEWGEKFVFNEVDDTKK